MNSLFFLVGSFYYVSGTYALDMIEEQRIMF